VARRDHRLDQRLLAEGARRKPGQKVRHAPASSR
jgi:hypothetical protein